MPRLEQWKIVAISKHNRVLTGFIYDDEKKRFPDGAWIRTSILKSTDEKTWGTTLFTTYELGEEYVVPKLKDQ